jgi:hypothetical protein
MQEKQKFGLGTHDQKIMLTGCVKKISLYLTLRASKFLFCPLELSGFYFLILKNFGF